MPRASILVCLVVAACDSRQPESPPVQPPASASGGDSIAPVADIPVETTGVLFEVDLRVGDAGQGPYRLNPIALIAGDSLFLQAPVSRREAAAGNAFRQRWYGPTNAFALYSRGVHLGIVRPVVPSEEDYPVCEDLGAYATLEIKGDSSPARGVAAFWTRVPHPANVIPFALEEESQLLEEARRILRGRGFSDWHLERVLLDEPIAVQATDHHPRFLVAAYRIEPDMDTATARAAGLIVGEWHAGRVAFQQLAYSDESGINGRIFTVLDVLDVAGDAQPEIFIRVGYWEAAGYEIMERTPAGWRMLFSSYAGGC